MRFLRFVWAIVLCCACSHSSPPGSDADAGGSRFEAKPTCESDGDCSGTGAMCAVFGDTGPSICGWEPRAPDASCTLGARRECCSDADCTEGSCVMVAKQPVQCSGTAGSSVWNLCLTDECGADTDCAAGQACTPRGFGYSRSCIPAACHSDADCKKEPGGVCLVLAGGCCAMKVGGSPTRPAQLACAYPSDGCQTDDDCAEGTWCIAREGRARCGNKCP